MIFGPLDEPMPDVDVSEQRLEQMLVDIKRNSRNRRIALFAPVVLAAAVIGAMIAAPPQHGGLALTADAESSDPQLPQVFGSNGVWRLAERIEDGPLVDSGPASMIEAPAEPDAPQFSLSPPDQEDLSSLPTSTSTPPTSTSGQSPDAAGALPSDIDDPTQLDWSSFGAVIRIEPAAEAAVAEEPAAEEVATEEPAAEEVATEEPAVSEEPAAEPAVVEESDSPPEDISTPDDVTVAAEPQTESTDPAEANPSTPPADLPTAELQAFSTPATIVPQSVLVYNSAHVSVSVQVVDDDSSVIDWCNTRVDWGDGSVSRVAGADDAALCTASCEYEATSSATSNDAAVDEGSINEGSINQGSINEIVQFDHVYGATIDAAPRIFVATGDGCSYTLAELQLAPFTVVPLP